MLHYTRNTLYSTVQDLYARHVGREDTYVTRAKHARPRFKPPAHDAARRRIRACDRHIRRQQRAPPRRRAKPARLTRLRTATVRQPQRRATATDPHVLRRRCCTHPPRTAPLSQPALRRLARRDTACLRAVASTNRARPTTSASDPTRGTATTRTATLVVHHAGSRGGVLKARGGSTVISALSVRRSAYGKASHVRRALCQTCAGPRGDNVVGAQLA